MRLEPDIIDLETRAHERDAVPHRERAGLFANVPHRVEPLQRCREGIHINMLSVRPLIIASWCPLRAQDLLCIATHIATSEGSAKEPHTVGRFVGKVDAAGVGGRMKSVYECCSRKVTV